MGPLLLNTCFSMRTSFQYLVFMVYFNYALNILIEKKRKGKFKCHVNVYLPLILRTCAVGTKKLSIRRNVVIIASCVLHLDLIIKDDDKQEVNYQ